MTASEMEVTPSHKGLIGLDNGEQFDEFFRRSMPKLITFLIVLGVDAEEAKDAAAEAMVRAYMAWDTVREPVSWVRVTAQRIAFRAHTRREDGVRKAVSAGWVTDRWADSDTVILKEEQEAVIALLQQLPEIQRVVMAWYIDGFAPAEIARHLNMNPDTARSHLRHARRRLRQALSRAPIGCRARQKRGEL